MKKEEHESFFDSYPPSLKKINGIHFTDREIDILAFLVSGRSGKKIAFCLAISPKTVENHIRNVMAKIECNAKESIIDFIEKSNTFALLRQHYANLLDRAAFEESLQRIAKIHRGSNLSCSIICLKKQQLNGVFITQLTGDLKLAGVSVFPKMQEGNKLFFQLIDNAGKDEFRICAVPNDWEKNHGAFSKVLHNTSEPSKMHDRVLFLLHGPENVVEHDVKLPYLLYNFADHINYYQLIFKIIEKIYPDTDLEKVTPKFNAQEDMQERQPLSSQLETYLEKNPSTNKNERINFFINLKVLKNKKLVFFLSCFMFFFLTFAFFQIIENSQFIGHKNSENSIRSNLNIPADFLLLNRKELMSQIEGRLKIKNQEDIKIVALVGIGGAGKTTIARQYARQQQSKVIWELNAETGESLKNSFEKLAQRLATTEEDEKILREIQEIKNSTEKEEKIILFVQEHLKLQSNWFLIYDNVEQFSDIQKYFPQDHKLWGQGKVILTTQNTNIQNSTEVNHMIHIGELCSEQKLELFTKIMGHGLTQPLTVVQEAETLTFLKNIPPFPLDVSVAAYYLKAANISYKQYLENLENYNKEFGSVQVNLLKETGNYLKTRYGIITLSIEHLIKSHKDFGELLLFISLLDSTHIPRELLNKHKGNAIIDNFIYHLKKYSLIKSDDFLVATDQAFSLHRSTQVITLAYLINKLNLEKREEAIKSISNTLINYTISAIEQDEFPILEHLFIHFQTFLTHKNLLNAEVKAAVSCLLGSINCCLYDMVKAKNLIENSYSELNKNYRMMAQGLTCLGIAERALGDHERAKKFLEQSVKIYEDHLSQNDLSFARTIVYLGDVYRLLEDLQKAKTFLKRGASLYRDFSANQLGVVRATTYLALAYRKSGEYEESKNLLEQSLETYRKQHSVRHIGVAQNLAHLGNVCGALGDDENAKNFLGESLTLFKKLFSVNHVKIAWVSMHLAHIYRNLGQYEKARKMLQDSLLIYKKHYPENNDWVVKVSLKLGEVEKDLGNNENAKKLFESGLKIHEKNSEINSRKIHYLKQLGDFYNGLENFKEAKLAYINCLEIYKNKFDESNPRARSKILLKLGEVYTNLGDYVQAENYFSKVITIYEKYYGRNHLRTAKVLINLGKLHLIKGDLNSAEIYLAKALKIFEKTQHSDIYMVLENLSNLFQKKAARGKKDSCQAQIQNFNKQSINYLRQALEVVKKRFPTDSSHRERIQLKLNSLRN